MSELSASSVSANSDTLEYGPYSGWAFVALALGLVSTTALVAPILWFIPVFAVAAAFIATRKIKAADPPLSGSRLAAFGLLLAVFFGIAGPARFISRQYYLEARAAHFADRFIEMLQHNEPLAAFQLTLPAGMRKPLAAGQSEPTDQALAQRHFTEFLKVAPIKSLLEAGNQAKIDRIPARVVASDAGHDEIAVAFKVQWPGVATASILFMDVERTLAFGSHTEQWQIIAPALREPEQ